MASKGSLVISEINWGSNPFFFILIAMLFDPRTSPVDIPFLKPNINPTTKPFLWRVSFFSLRNLLKSSFVKFNFFIKSVVVSD